MPSTLKEWSGWGLTRQFILDFAIMNTTIAYNIIIERLAITSLKPTLSTDNIKMQFESDNGNICKVFGEGKSARWCY